MGQGIHKTLSAMVSSGRGFLFMFAAFYVPHMRQAKCKGRDIH